MEEAVRRYLVDGKPPALLPALFKLCSTSLLPKQAASALASQLHADASKRPLSPAASNSLISCYLRAARPDLALAHLRCPSTPRDDVTYNTLFTHHLTPTPASLRLFRPNAATLISLLRTSSDRPAVVHAYLVKTAYVHAHLGVTNSLLAMYAASGDPSAAANLFDEMPVWDVVSWTSMIGACLEGGSAAHAMRIFRELIADSTLELDGVVLVVALRACGVLEHLGLGSSLHAVVVRHGLQGDDVFVANSLVDMYAKCLDLQSARKVFELIADKNVVSWNSMLSGLVHADYCTQALELISSSSFLTGEGCVNFDETTLVVLLQLCKKLEGQTMFCRSVHAAAVRRTLSLLSMSLLNALLDAYAKCGLLDHTLRLFQGMQERNSVTWSTVITACAHNGRPHMAMAFSVAMREAGEKPNTITMLSLLEGCAACADMRTSKCAHGVAIRSELSLELDVSNALVDMYGKCGDLAASTRVFEAMSIRDVPSWNSMMGALGMNGRPWDALALLDRMERKDGVKPNSVTMLAVLSACAHGGLVEEGISCFERMTCSLSLQPQVEHLSCIVDMLARTGDLDGARRIIEERMSWSSSPEVWSAVLSACRMHGEHGGEIRRDAASRILELEPGNSAGYLMAMRTMPQNQEVARMRWLMKERGVKVRSGESTVHVDGEAHRFVSWDGSHPHRAHIYYMLHLLHQQLRPPLPLHSDLQGHPYLTMYYYCDATDDQSLSSIDLQLKHNQLL